LLPPEKPLTRGKRDRRGRFWNLVMLFSVCIATYRRPALLRTLLGSLERQELPHGVDLELVVVDNDAGRSAETVVQEEARRSRHAMRYDCQPIKNISLTRNRTVARASGRYLLFIDDDERASARWVASLVAAQEAYAADGVFGPVMPEFDASAPAWIRESDLFDMTVPETGARATATWSGNCLVKADLLKQRAEPFDPRYGLTGGEDTYLFDSLQREGARFVYCREALVWEQVPPERASVRYLLGLGFRWGNTHARRALDLTESGRGMLRLWLIGKAICFGTISLAMSIGTWSGPAARTRWLMRLASNAGRFMAALGWHYAPYRSR
jgi:succinoglycan biosynthesis protein ExoM